ncbi:MAG: hypothetical protein AB7U82_24550 [Blastocatellales bacterium]
MHSEAAEFVLRALQQSSQPLTVTKLEKAIPQSALKSKKDLPELLKQMVKADQIRCHKARSSVYWLPNLEDQASDKILEALSEVPLTQADLENKLRSQLIGWPPARRKEMFARLIKEKRVYKVSPLAGKALLLSARAELTPQDYIKLALHLAAAKLEPLGFTVEHVFAATQNLLQQRPTADKPPVPPPSFDQTVLERMIQLKLAAVNGALVSLTELRRSLAAEIPEKSPFDRAVLRLAEQGIVMLHRHDYPSGLSQQERDALVSDERENYFIGISKV